MTPYRRWKPDETEKLESLYGRVDTPTLCKRLGVSYARFREKAKATHMGYQRTADEYITVRQLRGIMKIGHYTVGRYIRAGLPVTRMKFGKGRENVMVRLNDLMKWLEAHQSMFNAAKIELYALGLEPEWLSSKRINEWTEAGRRDGK